MPALVRHLHTPSCTKGIVMSKRAPFAVWVAAASALLLVAGVGTRVTAQPSSGRFDAGGRGSLPALNATTPIVRFHAMGGDDDGRLRVMTYNVNEGSDFLQVQGATTTTQFLIGVGQIISQVQATNPPLRMQAVASQIIAAKPTLVSLEELDQWYTGSFDPSTSTCGPMTLEYDMVQELLTALAAQGAHYQLVVQGQQYAFPPTPGLILPSTFICAQVVNHVAILARTDLDPWAFQLYNPQTAQYVNMVSLPTPIGNLPEPRAWVSVDAVFHGHPFRFIGTHLESVDAHVRELQGGELRAGPANVRLPVIIAMDSNAQAAPLPQDPTYIDFRTAGYQDAWSELFPLLSGFTCCQAELDNNPVSQLYQRIDLILTRGPIEARRIGLFGADPSSRTSTGLWPSDHAGVAAILDIDR
jgi:lysophospholipase L1-like esterase